MFPHGITVTVVRMAQDKFGDDTTATEFPVRPCGIDYGATAEQSYQRETVTRGAVLYAPAGSDIRPTDRVRLPDSTIWQVVGDVAAVTNPFTGWSPGTTVAIQRVTG